LLDGEQVVLGAVGTLLCGPRIAHQQACGYFVSKQMMQILKRLFTDMSSWFSSLCPMVFSDELFGDEAVKQRSLLLFFNSQKS